MKISNLYLRLRRDRSGSALIEFALALPVLLLLFFGTIEIANFVYASQKAQSAAENIVNIINLQNNVSTSELESMSAMMPRIVRPFLISDLQYQVIVTAMQRDVSEPYGYIRWQKSFGMGGGASRFIYKENGSKQENRVDLHDLDGFAFSPGDQVLVVETYMYYQPIFDNTFTQSMLGLQNSYLYHSTPPTRPRTGKFQFHPDDLI